MKLRIKRKHILAYITLVLLVPTIAIAALTGPRIFDVAVSITNNAPTISYVNGSTVTPIENGTADATVTFNVTDADGIVDIDNSTIIVNASLGGASSHVFRYNDTGNCDTTHNQDSSDTIGYTCDIAFWYYDNASTSALSWEINVTVLDQGGSSAHNDTGPFNVTVNSLSAFQIVQRAILATTSVGTSNVELTFTFNNTGNFDFDTLNLTPFDLNASLTDFFRLDGNFSINGTTSGSGVGSPLRNGSPIVINDTTGPINLTHARSDGSLSHRDVYIYIDIPSADVITPGATYNTTPGREWQAFAE